MKYDGYISDFLNKVGDFKRAIFNYGNRKGVCVTISVDDCYMIIRMSNIDRTTDSIKLVSLLEIEMSKSLDRLLDEIKAVIDRMV